VEITMELQKNVMKAFIIYSNKKGSLSANLCALRLGLEPRTL
jgi:hypothetical protein